MPRARTSRTRVLRPRLGRPSLRAVRTIPRPLALLLAIAAVLAVSWNVATAQLQGPDEADHIAYTARLAETGHIPSATGGSATYAPDEATALYGYGYLRLLQNRLVRPPWSPLQEPGLPALQKSLPDRAPRPPPG